MSRPLPLAAWTCPNCFVGQALHPNVLAPSPDGVFVACPDCSAIAIHHPHPSTVRALREWAQRVVSADVDWACRMFEQEADA